MPAAEPATTPTIAAGVQPIQGRGRRPARRQQQERPDEHIHPQELGQLEGFDRDQLFVDASADLCGGAERSGIFGARPLGRVSRLGGRLGRGRRRPAAGGLRRIAEAMTSFRKICRELAAPLRAHTRRFLS